MPHPVTIIAHTHTTTVVEHWLIKCLTWEKTFLIRYSAISVSHSHTGEGTCYLGVTEEKASHWGRRMHSRLTTEQKARDSYFSKGRVCVPQHTHGPRDSPVKCLWNEFPLPTFPHILGIGASALPHHAG